MKQISVMMKPASAMCGLRCRYCFYDELARNRNQSSCGIMDEECADRLIQTLAEGTRAGDQLTLAFQGGEPMLAGLAWFRAFVAKVNAQCLGRQISYALQTNGMALDERWRVFLRENSFLVGLSLDLPRACHDRQRVDAAGKGTYARVVEQLRLLQRDGVAVNVLSTLTEETARHPQQVWKTLCDLGIQYIQFTPCLDSLQEASHGYALSPERFASFYGQLFERWTTARAQGKRISIKLFDDLVYYLAHGIPAACGLGGRCQAQLVVESDGSIYPCDFYCLDQYRIGHVDDRLDVLHDASLQVSFKQHSLPDACWACSYARFCGGGCQRMRREVYCGGMDCGMKRFLDQCGDALAELAMWERRYTAYQRNK